MSKSVNKDVGATDLRMRSSEYGDVNLRPYLEVEYSLPSLAKTLYIKDHLGSTRVVVREDGSIKEAYDFYPFGLKMPGRTFLSGMVVTKNLFTGKERDSETGWDYFGARYYDPALGKFLSVDPHGDSYPSTSPFVYVGNNPVRFIDPTGMDSTDSQDDLVDIGNGVKLHKNLLDDYFGYLPRTNSGDSAGKDKQDEESTSNSNWLYWTSNGLNAAGATTSSLELSKVQYRRWRGTNGKWYPLSYGGNQNTGARSVAISSANGWRLAGRTVFYLGAGVSTYQGISSLMHGNYAGASKAGLDIAMGYLGTTGGPVGLGLSVIYFGVDATIGWGNLHKHLHEGVMKNQAKWDYHFGIQGNKQRGYSGGLK